MRNWRTCSNRKLLLQRSQQRFNRDFGPLKKALAAAARKGGDVQQAPGEAPQSGGDSRNAQKVQP
jgi:hypothetical protein